MFEELVLENEPQSAHKYMEIRVLSHPQELLGIGSLFGVNGETAL